MLIEIAIITTFVAFLSAVVGTLMALTGAFTKNERLIYAARNALLVTFPLLTLSCGILIYAQYTGDYNVVYVSSVSNNAQPDLLKITALWGGQAGSLLFWTWLLSLFIVGALLLNWKSEYHLMPWVMVFAGATLAFFLVLNNFYENPFERFWAKPNGMIETAVFSPVKDSKPAYPYQMDDGEPDFFLRKDIRMPDGAYDGNGLNPMLRHPGMVIHPPMLYLGFTGFIIPFAFAMAALATGSLGIGWIKATRRWSLIAWMFLSLGLILGGRWAYDVLGWGGYWGWDPVENSSLLPWLTGTAFLHSVMIQERRGMLKGWNMIMIILTYLLVIFGTVATRTGLLSSVHSFAKSPLAIPMGIFLAMTTLASIGLFVWRGSQGHFENDHALEGLLSRESLFLLNNWIFLAMTAVVFWGTWAELITGLMRDAGLIDNVINLGPEYYEAIMPLLFVPLFFLMGVAPLVAWRWASAQRLGRAILIPAGITAVIFLVMSVQGIHLAVGFSVGMVIFAGMATLIEIYKGAEARHRAHQENWLYAMYRLARRNQRRYGGYIIHLGVLIMGIGIIASSVFQETTQKTLAPGESLSLEGYTLFYINAFEGLADDGRGMLVANTTLVRQEQGTICKNVMSLFDKANINAPGFINRECGTMFALRPRRDFFGANSSPMTIAGTHSTIKGDFYSLLTFREGDHVTVRVYYNPLINFVWWGGLILILGTAIAVWPDPEISTLRKRKNAARQIRPQVATAGD